MEAFINYLKSKEMSQNTISSYSYAVSQFLSCLLYTSPKDSPWESLFDFRASRTCRGFRPSSSADAG